MSTPLTLLSLPVDVLHEILAHILLSPVSPGRASILRTCSTLNFIGLPVLYRVVDLAGYENTQVGEVWETFFGENGLFADRVEGGEAEERREGEGEAGLVARRKVKGAWVRHLLLGSPKLSPSFVVGTLSLPNCFTLSLHNHSPSVRLEPALPLILSQLPIRRFILVRNPDRDDWLGSDCEVYPLTPYHTRLGLASPPWPDLRSIEFNDILVYEGLEFGSSLHRNHGLALQSYPFRKLVLCLDPLRFKRAPFLYHNLFKVPGTSYVGIERIEMRVAMEIEESIRKEKEKSSRTGLNALEERLGPLMVFVDEDGTERRLVES